jgi:hypothetical protein
MSYGNNYGGGPPVAAGNPYANPVGGGGYGGGHVPNLNPPSRADMAGPRGAALPPFMRTPIWPPQVLLSTNSQVAHAHRDYVTEILNATVNVETVTSIKFDIPVLVYAMQASVQNTAALGTGLSGNGELNSFLCSIEHGNGDRLTTQATLGGNLFGTGERPRLVGGNGYVFDRGSTMIFNITPLAANMRISIDVWCIEERGPRNITR